MKIFRNHILVALISLISTLSVWGASITDNNVGTYNGTFDTTQWSVPNLGVIQTNAAQPGTYTSPVDDAGIDVSWDTLAWNTDKPYGKELPGNGGSDTGYKTGNISMTNNLALWRFNEAPGAMVFADSSGNSNTANRGSPNITNSTTTNIFNNSLEFRNANGYLTTQNGNSVKNQSVVSLALWLRTPSAMGATDQIIYDEPVAGNATITRFTLRIQNSRLSLRGSTTDIGPTVTWLNSTNTLIASTWYHVVAVFNSVTGVQKIYVNGVVESANVVLSAFPNTNPFNTPRIGRASTGTNNLSTAFIDEMALFTRELSAQEVLDMLDRGNRLRFQIQTCLLPALCTVANFKGPDGTNITWYSELNSITPSGSPSFTLNTSVTPIQRYVQYQAQFQNFTSLNTMTAILKSVTIVYIEPASLSFSIRDNTDTTAGNLCNLRILSVATTSTCDYRLKVSTTANNGYSIFANTSGSLSNGTFNMSNASVGTAGTGGSNISNATAGIEKYGVVINPGSVTSGTISRAAAFNAGANNAVQFNQVSNQTIVTATSSNSPTTPDITNTVLVTHRANIAQDTAPGQYTQSVTYTIIPIF